MALAVMHVIGAIIILDLLRHYVLGKKKFPRYLIVIGGIAGLAPDLDIPASWILNLITGRNMDLHAISFTHSFLFVLLFLFIGLFYRAHHNQKWEYIFYVISAGWLIHLGFDWGYGEYKQLLWPFFTPAWIFPSWNFWQYGESIDAIVLVLWLVHEEMHKFVKDYF